MAERIIQRVVFPAERRLHSLYYRVEQPKDQLPVEPEAPDRFSIRIGCGSMLATNAYFNTFFEAYWRRYTRLDTLKLRLELTGTGTVRLQRRAFATGQTLLETVNFDFEDGRGEVVLEIPAPRINFRELGGLYFEVVARSEDVRLVRGEWLADVPEDLPRVKLAAGYCTFNRESFLLDNVRALLSDPAVATDLARVVVVDQGSRKIRDHADYADLAASAGSKLQVVEQGNFGGAGGFTRTIVEGRNAPGATHMLLMDDDAILEPESVFRAAAFLSLASEEIAVGGQMLDMLRPHDVYEAGSWVQPGNLGVGTPLHRYNVDQPQSLDRFLEVFHIHYNAWWFFAFPLSKVESLGLPMPLFIRGDDVEYGSRLRNAGVPTATIPGLAIWHEPFYLKKGGWQNYYDLRNILIVNALHYPIGGKATASAFLNRLFKLMLAYRYQEVALQCEGAEDFLKGPEILEGDPQALHKKALEIKKRHEPGTLPRSACMSHAPAPTPPISLRQRTKHLVRMLWTHLMRPSPSPQAGPSVLYQEVNAEWWAVGQSDVVAVDDWHSENHSVFRRDRATTRALTLRALKIAWRLRRENDAVSARWRDAFGRLTSPGFWQGYLGLDREGAEDRSRRAA